MRSRVSLPSGHSTAIPRGEPSHDHRSHCPLPSGHSMAIPRGEHPHDHGSHCPLPSGHNTAIPRREPSQDHRSNFPLPFEVRRHFVVSRLIHPMSDPVRPSVSYSCTKNRNTLSTFFRTAASFPIFRLELKTLFFKWSFD